MPMIRASLVYPMLTLMAVAASMPAQDFPWSDLRGKRVLAFDWNCTQPKLFPKKDLQREVQAAIPADDRGQLGTWGDRALNLKLSNMKGPVYFVPLVCGATGNCGWRLYFLKPTRYLGKIAGEYIYTYRSSDHTWPTIVTYTHMSVSEGILVAYRFRKGRYRQVGGEYAVSASVSGTSDFGLQTHKSPTVLDRIDRLCREYGQ